MDEENIYGYNQCREDFTIRENETRKTQIQENQFSSIFSEVSRSHKINWRGFGKKITILIKTKNKKKNEELRKYVYMKCPVGIFALGSPRSDKNKQLPLWPRHVFIIIPFRCPFCLSRTKEVKRKQICIQYIYTQHSIVIIKLLF